MLNTFKYQLLNIFFFGLSLPLDLYQITMAYAYWKSGKTDDHSVFDLFFRSNPFHGEFTIFAGLDECLRFLESFHYSESGEFNIKMNYEYRK